MSHSRQRPARRDWVTVLCAAGVFVTIPVAAETATNIAAPTRLLSAPASIAPPLPPQAVPTRSPVDFFRKLLAMTPAERASALTNRPPAIRVRILAKVNEYAALDPDDRELRLCATELRWYLLPLLRESPTNRTARLAAVPADLRPLVRNRLQQWDILPPPLQKEFLASERTLRYFTHVEPPNSPPLPQDARGHQSPPQPDQMSWNALSKDQRQQMTVQFNRFFELTAAEKQKALNTLSDSEREQMEKTLATYSHLPPVQRLKCLRAFTEFASMSPTEKQDFLKNAQRWSQMSPKERQTWRDLVTHVPEWPPIPAALMPPMPPQLSQRLHPLVATNPD